MKGRRAQKQHLRPLPIRATIQQDGGEKAGITGGGIEQGEPS
jgi:hypothetical protein